MNGEKKIEIISTMPRRKIDKLDDAPVKESERKRRPTKEMRELQAFQKKRMEELGWLGVLPNEILQDIMAFSVDQVYQFARFSEMPEPFPSMVGQDSMISLMLNGYLSNPINANEYVLISFCESIARHPDEETKKKVARALKRHVKHEVRFMLKKKKKLNVIIDITIGDSKRALRNGLRLLADEDWVLAYCYLLMEDIGGLSRTMAALGSLLYSHWNYFVKRAARNGKYNSLECILGTPTHARISWTTFHCMYRYARHALLTHARLLDKGEHDIFLSWLKAKNDQKLYNVIQNLKEENE